MHEEEHNIFIFQQCTAHIFCKGRGRPVSVMLSFFAFLQQASSRGAYDAPFLLPLVGSLNGIRKGVQL